MRPRLEVAELLSFRLQLPPAALEALLTPPHDTFLALTREDEDWVLSDPGADSFLRFRPVREGVALTDAALLNDPKARFLGVLASLVIRFEGDLEAQLVWADEARNNEADWTHLHIRRGQTRHPALAVPRLQNQLRQVPEASDARGAEVARFEALPKGLHAAAHADDEAEEIARLLVRAEAAWAEYQRLKSERTASGTD